MDVHTHVYTRTYIHTTLAANPWPTGRDPMPRADALGNNEYTVGQVLIMRIQ